jgi:hypothetical protein
LYAVIGLFMGRISRAKKAVAPVSQKCNQNSAHLFTTIFNSQWSVVRCTKAQGGWAVCACELASSDGERRKIGEKLLTDSHLFSRLESNPNTRKTKSPLQLRAAIASPSGRENATCPKRLPFRHGGQNETRMRSSTIPAGRRRSGAEIGPIGPMGGRRHRLAEVDFRAGMKTARTNASQHRRRYRGAETEAGLCRKLRERTQAGRAAGKGTKFEMRNLKLDSSDAKNDERTQTPSGGWICIIGYEL